MEIFNILFFHHLTVYHLWEKETLSRQLSAITPNILEREDASWSRREQVLAETNQ